MMFSPLPIRAGEEKAVPTCTQGSAGGCRWHDHRDLIFRLDTLNKHSHKNQIL